MTMYLFGVHDCRRPFSDKIYSIAKIKFPIREAKNNSAITTIAAIKPVDRQLQFDGNNADVLSDKDNNASALILMAKQFVLT